MTTFKLTIEYDGAPFSGWQHQVNGSVTTVEGEIEKALAVIMRHPIDIQGASRTDAGVHARGQVASFSTSAPVDAYQIARGISAICRPHIAVTKVEIVLDDFNARFNSKKKHYIYRVLNRSAPSPLHRRISWHVHQPLNIEKMRLAAAQFVGVHDFAGFRAADCQQETTLREIESVEIIAGNPLVEIHVKGTAFLKNMVRIMAGTLVDVGRGGLSGDAVGCCLVSGRREDAGITAPAHGLTLQEIYY